MLRRCAIAIGLVWVLLFALPVFGQTATWIGDADGGDGVSWNDPDNWEEDAVPANDGSVDVIIAKGGTINLKADRHIKSLLLNSQVSAYTRFEAEGQGHYLKIESGAVTAETNNNVRFACDLAGHNGMQFTGASTVASYNQGTRFEYGLNNRYTGPTESARCVMLLAGGGDQIPDESTFTVQNGSIINLLSRNEAIGLLKGQGYLINSSTGYNPSNPGHANIVTVLIGLNGQSGDFEGRLGHNAAGHGEGLQIIKIGTGTQTLSGSNIYIGGTVVQEGVLNVTGSLRQNTPKNGDGSERYLNSSVEVRVDANGTLTGTGIVGDVVTTSGLGVGGTIQPGIPPINLDPGAIGIFTVKSADLSTGQLAVRITGFGTAGTDYDQLVVQNDMTLDANSRLLVDLDGVTGLGTALNAVNIGGTLTGQFDAGRVAVINNPNNYKVEAVHNTDPANPISIDLKVLPPEPAVNIFPVSGLTTSENGGTASFQVSLTTAPTDPVTVNLVSSDTTEGTLDLDFVTFDASNFDQPVTITVTGADDALTDGNIGYSIQATITSADADYGAMDPADPVAVNLDDDILLVIPESPEPDGSVVTDETGVSANFTVKSATSVPAGTEVLVPISVSDASEGQLSKSSVKLDENNWDTGVAITLTGVDDPNNDGDIAYQVRVGPSISANAAFDGLVSDPLNALNVDDEINYPPTVTQGPTPATDPGFTGHGLEFTIAVEDQNFDPLTVTWDFGDGQTGDGLNPTHTYQAPGTYNVVVTVSDGFDPIQVNVTVEIVTVNADSLKAVPSAPAADGVLETSESGKVNAFTVKLDVRVPTGILVEVPIAVTDLTEAQLQTGTVVLDATNWDTGVAVQVTGLDDDILDGNVAYQITVGPTVCVHAALDGLESGRVDARNLDNEVHYAPEFTSQPDANPNPVLAGHEVQFYVAASDANGDPLTISWDFGDGNSGSGTNPTHIYETPGTYTVTVIIDDGHEPVPATLEVFVAGPLFVQKLMGKGLAARSGRDKLLVKGVLFDVPAGFSPAGKVVAVSAGGTTVRFTLDARGRGTPEAGTAKLKMRIRMKRNRETKEKVFPGGDVRFAVLVKGDLRTSWVAYGVDAETTVVSTPATVLMPVILMVDGVAYGAEVRPVIKSKAGRVATFKYSMRVPRR